QVDAIHLVRPIDVVAQYSGARVEVSDAVTHVHDKPGQRLAAVATADDGKAQRIHAAFAALPAFAIVQQTHARRDGITRHGAQAAGIDFQRRGSVVYIHQGGAERADGAVIAPRLEPAIEIGLLAGADKPGW